MKFYPIKLKEGNKIFDQRLKMSSVTSKNEELHKFQN